MRAVSKSSAGRKYTKVTISRIFTSAQCPRRIIKVSKSSKAVNAKIGSNMDMSRFRINQSVVETPNGVITVFTLSNSESYSTGLLEVFLDGLQQIKDVDWTETTSSTFTFIDAPDSDENIRINYIKQ